MEANIHEVGKLFQTQYRLVVPIYQRPYVWSEEDQWEPLWSDIRRLAEQISLRQVPKPHFLGAVVVDVDPQPIGYLTCHMVVDGQQRLTTIQLFLEALADNYERICGDGYEAARIFASRARRITRNGDLNEEDKDGEFKVWPMNVDQAPFRAVMSAGTPEHLRDVHGDNPVIMESRISRAYVFFYERIRGWLHDQLEMATAVEALFDVVQRYLQIAVINLQNSVDPQLIFETLNARGTPLEASDLIKNFLFHQAALERADETALYAKYWEPFERENPYWSERIGKGLNRRPRLDAFVFQYLTMKVKGDVQVKRLYQEYRDYADRARVPVVEQMSELERYGQIYRSLDSLPEGSPEATFIYRLRMMDNTTVMPFVLALMGDSSLSRQDRIQVMRDLESFLVRRLVCNLTAKAYNRLFVELVKLVDDGAVTPAAIREHMLSWSDETTVWPDDDAFRSAWMTNKAYNLLVQARVRMILEALEPLVRSNKSEDVVYLREALTIEHLLPQKWRDHYPLPGDGSVDEFERDRILHTFGNLTLLTKKLNPSVSNGRWSTDRDLTKDKGKRVEILRHSSLGLNSMLVDHDAWDESAIKQRGAKLFEAALKVWSYPKV